MTVVRGLGFGVGVPIGMLWSKNSSCTGPAAVERAGWTCTQYSRQSRVCPRAASVQPDPGVATGRVAMAKRTVSAVGPSASLQVSGLWDVTPGGVQPQDAAVRLTNTSTTTTWRTRQA